MKYKAHTVGALVSACGLIYISKRYEIEINPISLLGGTIIGGLFPDIDHPKSLIGRSIVPISTIIFATVGHRTLTHSLLFATIIGLLTSIFSLSAGIGISVGILSHIILDLLTPGTRGVAFLYPFNTKKLRLF